MHKIAATLIVALAMGTANLSSAQSVPAPGSTLRVQGTIQADAGQGMVALTSHATTLSGQLGQQTAAHLQTASGQAIVQRSDARAKAATGQGVNAADVQAFAEHYAGKTVYASTMLHVPALSRYLLTLDARAEGGPRILLDVQLDENTLAPVGANVAYYPDSGDLLNDFRTGKKTPATVHIDKIERVNDKVYAVSGSFSAADLQPRATAKKLQGQTLPAISGHFAFTEVPLRDK